MGICRKLLDAHLRDLSRLIPKACGIHIMLNRIRGQDDIPHIDLISKRTCNSSIYDPAHMIPVH